MTKKCSLCDTPVERPANIDIRNVFKTDGVVLCLSCYPFYVEKRYWLCPSLAGYTGKASCEGCACHRPLFNSYCTPCWGAWDNAEKCDDGVGGHHDHHTDPSIRPSAPPLTPERNYMAPSHDDDCYHGDEQYDDASEGSEEMWQCVLCTLHNPQSTGVCDACGGLRPKAGSGFAAQPEPQQQLRLPQTPPPTPPPQGGYGGYGGHGSVASRPPPQDTEDDDEWECPSCTLVNDVSDSACAACMQPRPAASAPAPAVRQPSEPVAAPHAARTQHAHHPPQDATWECAVCTLVNEASDARCSACDSTRDTAEDGTPADEGWPCPYCTYVNAMASLLCEACDKPKAASSTAGGLQEEEQVDGWECAGCTYVNPDIEVNCAMCDGTRPRQHQAERPPSDDEWQCGSCTLRNDVSVDKCEVCGVPRKGRRAKIITLKADPYDTVLQGRQKKAPKKKAPPAPAPRPMPKPQQAPPSYHMGGRSIMIIDNLKKSDKVNNHALRLVFDRMDAINVLVIVKDGKKTGRGAAEFENDGALHAAIAKTKSMTVCESKIKTRRCTAEDFAQLPLAWKKGRPMEVQRPAHLPVGPRPTHRVAVVRESRCRNDKCSRECMKICPVGAVNDFGICRIDESKCTGCNMCMKKRNVKHRIKSGCPFDAIAIVNLPKEATDHIVNRYGRNGFTLCHLPRLKPDRLLGIIGENGSGKSTALKILSGRITPNAGETSASQSDKKWPAVLKARFKGTELQPLVAKLEGGSSRASLKVQHVDKLREEKGTVLEFLQKFGSDKKRIDRFTEDLTLQHLLDRPINVLSGGEIQRTAIAAAAVKESDIYLFDEPSSYLDVKMRLRACEVIRDLLSSSGYVVCVEHDLAVCDYLADSVTVLHGQQSAYGVVSKTMNVRDGINAFLNGHLEQENVKIRDKPLVFRMHDAQDLYGSDQKWSYPRMCKTRGSFSLTVEASELNSCEVTAFLGENGCGKTTLLEIMSGSLETDGEGSFDRKGYLKPQEVRMPTGVTVAEYVNQSLGDKMTKNKVLMEEVMVPLKIADLGILDTDKLSGGEMQRVALALALSSDNDLLLIDEPSAFLDAEQRMTAARAIRRIAVLMKKTIVVVEHDLMMTSFMADKVVVFEGTPGVESVASPAEFVSGGMNRFLRQLDVTVRLDGVSHRPRFNKKGSVLDRDQRSKGQYYADAAEIKERIDGLQCHVCDCINSLKAKACQRCGIPLNEDED